MDAQTSAYYSHMTRGLPVEVCVIPGKAKSLRALKAFKKDEVLFMENPLGSLQHGSNAQLVHACDNCLSFIGTLRDHFETLATVQAPSSGTSLPADAVEAAAAEYEEAFPSLPADWKPPAVDDEAAVINPVVPCSYGCGASFCSERCRAQANARYHVLLCPSFGTGASNGAMVEEDHGGDDTSDGASAHEVNAAVLFAHQARCTNEIFLLAARLIARVLEAWVRNGNDMHSALLQCTALHSEEWAQLFARTADAKEDGAPSTAAAGRGAGGIEEEEEDGGEGSSLQSRVREWLRDSLTILRSLLQERMPSFVEAVESAASGGAAAGGAACGHKHAPGEGCGEAASSSAAAAAAAPARSPSLPTLRDWEWDLLLSESVYSRLVGAFELNNIEVKVPSPLLDYVGLLQSLPTTGGPLRSPQARALAGINPVLEQIAAAKDARRQLRRRLRKMEEAMCNDGDEGGEEEEEDCCGGEDRGHGHSHGHSHGHGEDGDAMDEDSEEEGSEEEDDDYGSNEGDSEEGDPDRKREKRHEGYGTDEESSGGDGDDDEEGALDPATLFPHANGTALFALISQMNHSCEPSVHVMYFGGSHTAAVQAKRPIAAGEELCINYVSVRAPRAQRQKELRHYGFTCACERCTAELLVAAEAASGPGGAGAAASAGAVA